MLCQYSYIFGGTSDPFTTGRNDLWSRSITIDTMTTATWHELSSGRTTNVGELGITSPDTWPNTHIYWSTTSVAMDLINGQFYVINAAVCHHRDVSIGFVTIL